MIHLFIDWQGKVKHWDIEKRQVEFHTRGETVAAMETSDNCYIKKILEGERRYNWEERHRNISSRRKEK